MLAVANRHFGTAFRCCTNLGSHNIKTQRFDCSWMEEMDSLNEGSLRVSSQARLSRDSPSATLLGRTPTIARYKERNCALLKATCALRRGILF